MNKPVIYRPGVAGAVLQRTLLLINYFIGSVTDPLWKYLHSTDLGKQICELQNFVSNFFYKDIEFCGGGSVLNKAYPV